MNPSPAPEPVADNAVPRRRLLQAAAVLPLGVTAAAAPAPAAVPAVALAPESPAPRGYHLSEHVQRAYDTARY
jgi:hypothetical protein